MKATPPQPIQLPTQSSIEVALLLASDPKRLAEGLTQLRNETERCNQARSSLEAKQAEFTKTSKQTRDELEALRQQSLAAKREAEEAQAGLKSAQSAHDEREGKLRAGEQQLVVDRAELTRLGGERRALHDGKVAELTRQLNDAGALKSRFERELAEAKATGEAAAAVKADYETRLATLKGLVEQEKAMG